MPPDLRPSQAVFAVSRKGFTEYSIFGSSSLKVSYRADLVSVGTKIYWSEGFSTSCILALVSFKMYSFLLNGGDILFSDYWENIFIKMCLYVIRGK